MDHWEVTDDVKSLVEDLISQYHPEAATAKVFWQFKEKASKSEWESGIVCSVKTVPDSMKEALREPFNFVCIIASDAWLDLSQEQRQMKIDSALCRIAFKVDEDGEQKLDKAGEPMWVVKAPDLMEFSDIVKRYEPSVLCGTNEQLLETFVKIKQDEKAEKEAKKRQKSD